jgi:hypothetical protein
MKGIDKAREALKNQKPDPDFVRKTSQIIKYVMAMKRNMLKKNLFRAKAKCPFCDGHWHARIAPNNKHIHMRCDGTCNAMMME